jgi:ketosteroid isomerase-like protein
MQLEIRDLLRVHASAINGRDVESLVAHATPDAACFCDGQWVGEGPEAVRAMLEAEYTLHNDLIARVDEHNGEPVIVEFGPDGQDRHATVRIRGDRHDGRIREIRLDHLDRPAMRDGLSAATR